MLPKGPKTLPFAALFSVLGALEALDSLVSLPSTPGIVTVILILGILQMLVAVGALLIEYDVVKPPAPKAAAPSYGGQYGQPGQQQYGQQGGPQFGQQQPGQAGAPGEPPAPFSQPGQYGSPNPPSTTPPPGQQATTYAPMQGQFFQQPPSNNPGTPPGGSASRADASRSQTPAVTPSVTAGVLLLRGYPTGWVRFPTQAGGGVAHPYGPARMSGCGSWTCSPATPAKSR